MDQNLTDRVQDVDNGDERDQAMDDSLRNPVIVRNILEHFSSKELLQISLVNKLWKTEARSVARNRGNLVVNLKSDDYCRNDTCQVVAAFISDLHRMSSIPASGISIDVDRWRHFCARPTLVPNHVDLDKLSLSLKSLSVRMVGPWLDLMDCSAILLATRVLQQFSGVLQEISLEISEDHEDFMDKVVQDCYFPRLQILKVNTWRLNNEDGKNYFTALLSRTPNLKMLHTNWDINSVLQLLQGTSTSVRLVYTTTVRAPFDEISESFISAINLSSLELKYTGPGFNFERFNRIAPMLLQASCTTTLREIFVDAVLAVSLMSYGVRLENVKYLRMFLNYSNLNRIDPHILDIVKQFDFTRIFPNLSEVCIASSSNFSRHSQNLNNGIIQQANDVLPTEPLVDRAVRIKKLIVCIPNPPSAAAKFIAEMFPKIEKLQNSTAGEIIPFGSVWNWSDLKEIQVQGCLLPAIVRRLSRFSIDETPGNLDSDFCGIFPEEVAELRLKDDEYLKRVHIVPVKPAITCLRNLRTLDVHYKHHRFVHIDDATFIFSKVTALLAFARLPALAVSLKISANGVIPTMDHLEPYVSITIDRFWR